MSPPLTSEGTDVGIRYDYRKPSTKEVDDLEASTKRHTDLAKRRDVSSEEYGKQSVDLARRAVNNKVDPYRNETRQRWMNSTPKDNLASVRKLEREYGPQLTEQLTERDYRAATRGDDGVRLRPSRRDRNPRYGDQFILALQEGDSWVDHADKNQRRRHGSSSAAMPRLAWSSYYPLQHAYSPTLPYLRPPRSGHAPLEREHPTPTGNTDSAGWLDRYSAQRLTPWVYVLPSTYSQTDVQFRTPRMDVLDTPGGVGQLKSEYVRYNEGGIPCVTNALSRDLKTVDVSAPGTPRVPIVSVEAGVHDLSYGHTSIEDALSQGTLGAPASFRPYRSPWEQGVSLVHFVFGSAVAPTALIAARTPAAIPTDGSRLEALATSLVVEGLTGADLERAGAKYTNESTRLAAQRRWNASRTSVVEDTVKALRSPDLNGGAVAEPNDPPLVTEEVGDPRRPARLAEVAEQSAIKWMEDCGLSLSVTLRDDVDPVYAGRAFNLVMRPPIEAFALWQRSEGSSLWSTAMGWRAEGDDDNLKWYRIDDEKVNAYSRHFQRGDYAWVMRDVDRSHPEETPRPPLSTSSPRSEWDRVYMRTRAYETRLTAAKKYYMHQPIELLSSSATMSAEGYKKIDESCLGCIYTGERKFDTEANGSFYRWPNPMRDMLTFLTAKEATVATGEKSADGFYRVAIVFLGEDSAPSHEASVEHVIAQRTIRKTAHVRVGSQNSQVALRAGEATPLLGDRSVRERFADYVCGDPYNWLVSVAGANRRRGPFPLAVCGDDLGDLVAGLRRSPRPTAADAADAANADDDEADDVVRGAHDHLFPVPPNAWLRVALVQIYMYLTYPGLPPLLGDDRTGQHLDAHGVVIRAGDRVDATSLNAPIAEPLRYARFGEVDQKATFVLHDGQEGDFTARGRIHSSVLSPPRSVDETRDGADVGRRWLRALVSDPVAATLESEMTSPSLAADEVPTTVGNVTVSKRTGRVVMTAAKRQKLFRILLRTVSTKELCEADVLLSELVQKATGFMLAEYELMCERLDTTRDDGTPLTSSDGAYAAWTANTDGVYGATISTRYPRGWRNPLVHWSGRRRRGFVLLPTIRRFLGAAMYGLTADEADEAADLAVAEMTAAAGRP